MFNILFLNLYNEMMINQTRNLEKLIDFKMHVGKVNVSGTEMDHQIRWAEKEKMDGIVCQWEDYDALMSFKPLIPLYPIRQTSFDTCVILYLLKKHLKENKLSHLKKVVLGTYFPINVSIDILEEMYDFEIINPPWKDDVSQSYIDEYAKEGYEIVVCGPQHIEKVRKSGMHPFHDERVLNYIDFSSDIKNSIQQVAMGTQLQRTLDELNNMINYSFEGICILDNQGKITAYNEKATDMFLKREDEDYNNQYFYDLVPTVSKEELQDIINYGKVFYSRIINANDLVGMLNITPNVKDEKVNGAVVHFTTVQQIEKMESQVKSEIYKKGHYAKYQFDDILGSSEVLVKTKKLAERFSKYHSNILLYGESGCGKELFAQSIHNSSLRANQPFVAINCGSLPTNLLESELFGYVEGAFTGALKKGKKGLFEIAYKGTIFLDEISEIDAHGQTRLLRVLEERCVMRIGDDKVIPIDVRVIAASNKNLLQLVKEGKFREDLYYRLNVLTLNIPPLRERDGDVGIIAKNYVRKYGKEYNKHIVLTEEAMKELSRCQWEGNIRQLRNFCERLVIVQDSMEVLAQDILEQIDVTEMTLLDKDKIPVQPERTEMLYQDRVRNRIEHVDNMKEAEIISIKNALQKTGGNREKTAEILGISKSTLWRKIKIYDLL